MLFSYLVLSTSVTKILTLAVKPDMVLRSWLVGACGKLNVRYSGIVQVSLQHR